MMTRLILPIILACVGFCLADFYTVYEWKYIDYVWKSDNLKTNYTTNGVYNCEKIIPNDVQPLPGIRNALLFLFIFNLLSTIDRHKIFFLNQFYVWLTNYIIAEFLIHS